ncbi:hypothetical protein H2200_006887 [Cladophialophora chaetospira]|uniref:AB hydrolase-1 domain-containing protein n=1 Tax=Cladophialophora chaetospira TaxID=386627 RepID=A0AA39CID1_9EURO|nr:hypothetical protein H2200_006887 [Cladophialophora chaetospira]
MNTLRRLITLGALIAPAALAAPGRHYNATRADRPCIELRIPVHVVANNSQYQMPRVDSTIDYVDWVWFTERWSALTSAELVTGAIPVNQTFTIHGQLCIPPGGSKADILQIATHGGGFDGRYWDVDVKPDEYSYVDAVLAAGYSILTYDCLGTGKSETPDAYDIVQAPVDVEVMQGLTSMARNGNLVSASTVISGQPTPEMKAYRPQKVVHVGHSIGSFLTIGFTAAYPTLSDGIILTGMLFSNESGVFPFSDFAFEYAAENDPTLFGDRGSGYTVQGTAAAAQLVFLKKGAFEPELLDYAVSTRSTVAVGEVISLGTNLGRPAAGFKGSVLFFVGEYDFVICDGDCNGIYEPAAAKAVYPDAESIDVYLQPGTGHGTTLAINATAGYSVIFDYLGQKGL